MHPVLLKIGPFSVYSYGVMVALGFAVSAYLIYKRAPDFKLDKNELIDLAILILLGGLAGARLLYVILNIEYYKYNWLESFNLSRGGLVWYGGFLSAFFIMLIYARKMKLNFWTVADLIAPYAALAQSFGRIGCFLNGCCFGIDAPKGFLLGVIFPGTFTLRQPTEIYSSVALLFIFIILRLWQDKRRFSGEIFLGYCALYSLKRFFMEFLRGDNPASYLGLTVSQLISIPVFLIFILIFIGRERGWKRTRL